MGLPSSTLVVRGILGVLILCLTTLVAPSLASNQVRVTWAQPSDSNSGWYNQWASRLRFRVGDSLLFVYPSDKDSVLVVSEEDYDNCNGDKPLRRMDDGNSVYTFDHSGPHYFISGVEDNCHKNEKMMVVVMADRSKPSGSTPPPPPSTPSSSTTSPPPTSSTSSPSPPSDGEPTSPPSGEESNPANPPPPPPNAAPSKAMSGMSLLGAVLGIFMFVS